MTGRDSIRTRLAAHAVAGVLVGEAVGVAGLCAGLGGNLVRTPLSELSTVGLAAGLALAGKRPVVELVDVAGLDRAREALADAAARFPGSFAASVVVIVAVAHDAVIPALPPGVRLLVAGVPDDAAALLEQALAHDGVSVVCLAPESLAGEVLGESPPDGVARRRVGAGATVLAEGAGVALALGLQGDLEVVDLRGERDPARIAPWVAATGRVVVVGHGDERVLLATLGDAFWRLESRPRALHASLGPEALARAVEAALDA